MMVDTLISKNALIMVLHLLLTFLLWHKTEIKLTSQDSPHGTAIRSFIQQGQIVLLQWIGS